MISRAQALAGRLICWAGWVCVLSISAQLLGDGEAPSPFLRHSDVVFMYHATADVYEAYDATHLAWGPTPTAERLKEAEAVTYLGSVGMVTEFAAFYERFPDRYEEGLCRTIDGDPIRIPWLMDFEHKGIPYWKCCTLQPTFRHYLRERVIETVRGGADGVHIDDHMGNAAFTWLGACFCAECNSAFGEYLQTLSEDELRAFGIDHPANFDFRSHLLEWRDDEGADRRIQDHPLWHHWEIFHHQQTVTLMRELKALATETAGHPVPFGANAGLLWPNHLTDYSVLDLFSAETEHRAHLRQPTDVPMLAYRLAEAVDRPYAATASGADWAFVKAHGLTELVRHWIAYAYASGQWFMAPHRQWCHTDFLGTHWYDGPTEIYAPLFRFIRSHPDLLNGFQNAAQVHLLFPYRNYVRDQEKWFVLAESLARTNLSYRLLLAGDHIVDHPLDSTELDQAPFLYLPQAQHLLPEDRKKLETYAKSHPVYTELSELREAVNPIATVDQPDDVRLFPRKKDKQLVLHLLNMRYDKKNDSFRPVKDLSIHLNPQIPGFDTASECQVYSPDHPELTLPVREGTVTLPELKLWSIVIVTGE